MITKWRGEELLLIQDFQSERALNPLERVKRSLHELFRTSFFPRTVFMVTLELVGDRGA